MVWRIPSTDKIYLTFDDGPIPEVTPYVLDTLAKYDAKATFFCVGENVVKYPDIYHRIINEGHSVGNHSHNHLNGWYTNTTEYIKNVGLSSKQIDSKLYRPPYGKLKPSQYKQLKDKYKVIMWDVLSMDYDSNVSAQKCFDIVIKNSTTGSIIVFHDNIKAMDKLKVALPKTLEYFAAKDWQISSIKAEKLNI